MSEAEILSIRNELTGIVVSVFSVSFGMISAYIAGLWLFLREAPISLRLLAFTMLTFGLAFMGALTWGLNDLLVGTERAWSKLATHASEITGFGNAQPPWLHGLTLYEAAVLLGGVAFGAIYVSLAYLTFIYKWPGTTAGPVRVAP
ncbi:hypothetical protein RLW55_14360 [Hyphomicrobium sp. B1]|uniref:hypothetical protein n=1 Tax=unclassified Hyphomicrobium TaxID=2619925 RepID=UPI0039C1920B